MEQENKKNEADNVATKDLANSSKTKSDMVKSMAKNFLKTRKVSANSKVSKKNQQKKAKGVPEGSKETQENAKKQSLNEENQQKDSISTRDHAEKSEQIQENQEITCVPDSQEKSGKLNDSSKKRTRKEEGGVSNKNKKRRRDWQRGKHGNSEKNDKNKEKHHSKEKKPENKEKHHGKEKKPENKQGKIDGLIFMCNAKTKPDCFHYRLMGVASSKKDLVMSIRPGLKLFLYDYDLKLMYGIYKASSSGGMKLEPKAFGGAFPAQVRFSVHADCFPLAERIFRKAIKENYNEKNKFKIELTARQVRKLTQLFQPVAVHSTALPVRSPPRAVARTLERSEIKEDRDRAREARFPSDREASARDPFARSYAVLSQERDHKIAYGGFASTRGENSRDFYLSEKDYRAYGLQGERRNATLEHTDPTFATYHRDYAERSLRQTDSIYRDSLPMQRERIHSDRHYLSEREHRTYDLDPYRDRYPSPSLVESYLPHPRGESHLIESNRRIESRPLNRLYPAYASDANPEAASVSSRYAFGGSSLSFR